MASDKNFVKSFVSSLKSIYKDNKVYLHEPFLDNKDIKVVSHCLKSRKVSTSTNSFYKKFESQLKKFIKSKYIFLTSTGTNALHLSLLAIKVKADDEVMLSSIGFVASLNSILYVKGVPHFLDCSSKDLGINYDQLKLFLQTKCKINRKKECINLVSKRIIRAIIVTHVFGFPAKIDKIKSLCKKFNIKVIEDAAEGLGSFYQKKHIGTFGAIGILSFNGNKIITTGAGGAVITQNKKYFNFIKKIGDISRAKHKYELFYDQVGYNYKMANINAALGYSQFKKLKYFLKYKKKLNKVYLNLFKKFDGKIKLITNFNKTDSNFWLQAIILENPKFRSLLIKECIKKNVYLRPIWKPLHKSKYIKKKFSQRDMKNTDYLYKRLICLPSGFNLLKK